MTRGIALKRHDRRLRRDRGISAVVRRRGGGV